MERAELELKFCIDAARLDGVRARVAAGVPQAGPASVLRLQAHYFDTRGGDLGAAGIAFRLRREGASWRQTLKAPGDSRVRRLEHEVGVAHCGRGVPRPDISRHDGSDAGRALGRALGPGGGASLAARHGTDLRRTRIELDAGGARIEIALDEGHVLADGRRAPVCEIEFELLSGDPAALFAVAESWRAAHGLWLSTQSKAERGERLARGTPTVPAAKAATPRIDAGMDGQTLLRVVVAACLDPIIANAGEIAAGSFDAGHVHQLRIGIRRLRAVLRELGALSPDVDAAWEAPLVRVFRALGELRDREAAVGAVQPLLRAVGAPLVDLPAPGPGELPDAARVVRDDDFQAALLRLLGFALAPPAASPRGDARPACELARRRLRDLHRKVTRDGRRFGKLDDASRHRVRKRLKRLRYLAENVAPLFDNARVERYLKRLRPAQDALGAYHDAQVALALYRNAARCEPRAWFAVGWLSARQDADTAACRKALAGVAAAPRFWSG